jgi:valyl-tRNA synthetase
MLHPLMPFITEELWHAMGDRPYDLIVAKWPEPQAQVDHAAEEELGVLLSAVTSIRSARTDLNIAPGLMLEAVFIPFSESDAVLFSRSIAVLNRLARVKSDCGPMLEEHEIKDWVVNDLGANIQVPLPHGIIAIKIEGIVDLDAERARLSKGAASAEKERDSLAQRLANPNFTERAKPEAVEKARSDHEAKAAEAERLRAALERLG